MSKTKIKRIAGFTLVEVMLAMLLLAILSVTVVTGIWYPRYLVVSAAQKQSAIEVANGALEEALSLGYDALTNYSSVTVPSDSVGGVHTMNGIVITGERVVELLGGAGQPEYKRITVRVPYPGDSGSPVVLQTLITP